MTTRGIALLGAGTACVAAVSYLAWRIYVSYVAKKKIDELGMEKEDVETLKLEDVIAHFKREDVLAFLKAHNGVVAVAIKQQKDETNLQVVLCAFNKEENSIVQDCAKVFNAKALDDDLSGAFGDKDMIVVS